MPPAAHRQSARSATASSLALILAISFLPVLVAPTAAAAPKPIAPAAVDPCIAPVNEVVAENCLPGTPASKWDVNGSGSAAIQGFATQISVNQGQTVRFKVDTPATDYRLDIYRMGYYQGSGARRVARIQPTAALPQLQPDCAFTAGVNLTNCGNWGQSASWAVPNAATSGVYFAKLVREDGTSGSSHIFFIVRDDDGVSDLLFQTSDTTWQAYNQYGGYSLYSGSGGHAKKVSYNRPFTTRGDVVEDWIFNAEYPMIRWIERNGYDVSYFTDADTDRNGAELLEHAAFLSVGHDEYWSAAQRDNVEAARTAGVHLAFFSGNEVYWKTRWQGNYRTLVTYKEGSLAGGEHFDCQGNDACDPNANVWTGLWRDGCASTKPDGCQPENRLTGQISWDGSSGALQVPARDGKLRFWRNTSVGALANGTTATLSANTLGYEWDQEQSQFAATYPQGRMWLSTTALNNETHHLSLYRATSGALVFGAGTVQWSWGLDGNHDRGPSTEDPAMQQATVNLFADMGVQPGSLQTDLLAATQSTDATEPTSTIASPADGADVPSGQIVVSGTATDPGAGEVAVVEVSVDGERFAPATGRNTWSFSFSENQLGPHSIRSRAVDDTGNVQTPADEISIEVVPAVCPCSIWNDATIPTDQSFEDDPAAVELGVKFRPDTPGFATGIRFFKGVTNTGTHVGHLWTASGTQLSEVTFTGESASGWQQAALDSPVALDADTTYVVSYFAPNGNYAVDANYFATAFDNPPLHALANGDPEGPNGVFVYGGGFPNQTFNATNYWVDVVFDTEVEPDVTPPTVTSTVPTDSAIDVAVGTNVRATFNEPMKASTIDGTRFELRDPADALVPATVSYHNPSRTATLVPDAELAFSTTYTATVVGGTGGVEDVAGNEMEADEVWSFTTRDEPPPPPDEGPDGPILVVTAAGDPFGRFYSEILRTEGFNEYLVKDISSVTGPVLGGYDTVVLAKMSLSVAQETMFADWVDTGGDLIAMRPDGGLAGLLGLTNAPGTVSEGYIDVDASGGPGAGITDATMQFHGTSDRYSLNGATEIAALFSDATTSTGNPAVTVNDVGSNGGQAAAFAYDLARSVVYTRQGNPDWAGDERDGQSGPIRANDLFFGAKAGDVQPDWVNLNKVAIPQADEQQRLLANMILSMHEERGPLPRFWYFPRGEEAVVLMTGDDHGTSNVQARFGQLEAASPAGCDVDLWECLRMSNYQYQGTNMTDAEAAGYTADGFEIGLHPDTGCANWTPASLDGFFDSQLSAFAGKFPSIPPQVSNRTHCIAWSDWATHPKVELDHGIRLDTNYYYWPPSWILNRPGMFTGSGMPMRFADLDGSTIDVYQAATQMTDESGQTYPLHINTLLDNAQGPQGYYGVFTANMHTDSQPSGDFNSILASVLAHDVPMVSGRQLLTWLDGRNASSFANHAWTDAGPGTKELAFDVDAAPGSTGLRSLLPATSNGLSLSEIVRGGTTSVPFTLETIKGIDYAMFRSVDGAHVATYITPPVSFTDTTQADFGAGTGDCVIGALTGNGEVTLDPALAEPFDGSSLPAGFSQKASPWTAGGAATVGGGELTVDGTMAGSDVTFAPGTSLEFVGTIPSGGGFGHIGFVGDLDFNNPWVIFSNGNDGSQLFARSNMFANVPLGAQFLDSPHRYRIDWTASGFSFSVDGVPVAQQPETTAGPMLVGASDFNAGGGAVSVDWMRVSPFASPCTFESRVFDGGGPTPWDALSWTSDEPAGTDLVVSYRSGDGPTPDGTWTAYAPVANSGDSIGSAGRYLQYRAELSTTDDTNSPTLEDVTATLA